MLYATPSGDADDTTAVTKSPAPFANANKVTPATTSDRFNHLLIYIIASAIYSSTRSQMNLKIRKIKNKKIGMSSQMFPPNPQKNI